MSQPESILLVEDDDELRALLASRLVAEGYEVREAADGPGAIRSVFAQPPDVVVLDVGLPGLNGFDVCRAIRADFVGPILFVTARDSELDEVLGLELGGDDYVVKPVSARVLIARIRALLRRRERVDASASTSLGVGAFVVDLARREVRGGDTRVALTTAEFDLLAFLAQRAGTDVDRDTLYHELLGVSYDGLDRTIDVQVARVRHKLEMAVAGGADTIRTVRGVGYLAQPATR
jgi:DNA-binding response OmpR family regulator